MGTYVVAVLEGTRKLLMQGGLWRSFCVLLHEGASPEVKSSTPKQSNAAEVDYCMAAKPHMPGFRLLGFEGPCSS